MNWNSWSEFFSMGGYGFYVWGSYLVSFICIAGEIWILLNRQRTLQQYPGQRNELNMREKKNETTS
ncbi:MULTISPECIES: heme exporter protein CcmD [Nitrosomonas]|jgi:heme exporter protein D|uniref:Heme exporter protein D n=2 Tax=Nitrosomonas communis TaxID=44574 RepID=A0A0F7KHB4_9PROT|nr:MULTISPECIES: heme exporter protein CcmD [Nitrosomonas]AKH38249.1 heme exporter protein CcmD [Nitrosomonas communis]TYP89494.1 heme exporter protein D [Nitrosomonas communis]UVS60226.1 heme exporter protein CcmD [Nitrosomonas sp. PLL12]SDW31223.1 heme exporter protein D [Nitrosomonas communis]